MKRVKDLMTQKVVSLKEGDDLGLADAILKLEHIRHLPVVRDGVLVGLVTHRDILRVCSGLPRASGGSITAAEVMTQEVRTVSPESSLRNAARIMLRNKYGCLPVVDKKRRLVGIVTESDLVRFAVHVLFDLDRFDELIDNALTAGGTVDP
jgi:CBS domain-containing protein